jgi:hypothetical protein
MTEDEILGTSDTGQTVSVRMMVSVTTMVVFWDSGRLAMPVAWAGQLVTVGAQLVMVCTRVVLTVNVVRFSVAVALPRGKCKCRPGWYAEATAASMLRAATVDFILPVLREDLLLLLRRCEIDSWLKNII